MKPSTPATGSLFNGAPISFAIWSVMGALTLFATCYLRYSEGPDGPWALAAAAGMASLFGIANGIRGRRALVSGLTFVLFTAVGAVIAWETAQLRHGYAAMYGFAVAWGLFLVDLALGGVTLIFRGSRNVGKRVVIAGICRLLAFYTVIWLAHATGHSRWHELEHSVKIPPTEPQ